MRNNLSLYFLFFLSFSGIHLPLISSVELNNQRNDGFLDLDYLSRIPSDDYIIVPGDKLRIIVSREYSELTSISD